MSHTVAGVTTSYTWDVNRSLPEVLQDGTNTYVYGLDLISSTDGAGNQAYFTYDGLGSTTDLTDGTGTVTGTYAYDVFGAICSQTGVSTNQRLFTGQQQDNATGDSGLYYLRARYYDPATGRFVTRDPLRIGNGYTYASNNPINRVDPYGLLDCGDLGPFGGACDEVTEVVDPVVDTVSQAVDKAVDQTNVTAKGVFIGGVLVYVGGIVAVAGVACLVIAIPAELAEGPVGWLAALHTGSSCALMASTGVIIYACGYLIALTGQLWGGKTHPYPDGVREKPLSPFGWPVSSRR